MRPPAVLLAICALLRALSTEIEATTKAAEAANSVRWRLSRDCMVANLVSLLLLLMLVWARVEAFG